MAYIKTPSKNESILQWAREITKEVNSLQPCPGEGINLTKTGAGTTYSIRKYGVPHADSMPNIIGGEIGENILSSSDLSGLYGTTYSIETGPQNSLALYEFSISSNTIDLAQKEKTKLSLYNILVRSVDPEDSVLSSPTLRYIPADGFVKDIYDAELSNTISWSIEHLSSETLSDYRPVGLYHFDQGETTSPEGDDDILIRRNTSESESEEDAEYKLMYVPLSALSSDTAPDSLMDDPVSKSIYKNSQEGLAIYHFEEPEEEDIVSSLYDSDTILIRRELSGVPTVNYINLSALSNALSVVPDSLADTVVSKSIYKNSVSALALYHFENLDESDIIDVSPDDTSNRVLVRTLEEDETTGEMIPTLKYANLSSLYGEDESRLVQFKAELILDNNDNPTGIKLYIGDLNSGVMVNSVNITQGGAGALVVGWNLFNGATALYLNIVFGQGAPGNLVSPTNIGDNVQGFVWNITNARPQNFVWSIKLCEIANGRLIVHHEGSVEVGAMIPDSADADLVGNTYRTKSLEFTEGPQLGEIDQQGKISKSGLRLYGFAPQALNGGIGGNEPVAEWFNSLLSGTKSSDSLALLYRDVDNGNGGTKVEEGTLKYLPIDTLDRLIVSDTDLFRFGPGLSRSIQNIGDRPGQAGETAIGFGNRLYNFYNITTTPGGEFTYSYPQDVLQSVLSASDVVIRKRHAITGVPEVGYIPLSTFLSTSANVSVDSESAEPIGKSIGHNLSNELEIYKFTDPGIVNSQLSTDTVLIRRLVENGQGVDIPQIRYYPLSALSSSASPVDSEADEPFTKSIGHNIAVELDLFDFEDPNPTSTLASDMALLRRVENGVPTLRYTNVANLSGPPLIVDSQGDIANSIGRNADNELELYQFSTAAGMWGGGTIPENQKSRIDFVVRRQQTVNNLRYISYDTVLSTMKEDIIGNIDGYSGILSVGGETTYNPGTHKFTQAMQEWYFRNGILQSVTSLGNKEVFVAVPEFL